MDKATIVNLCWYCMLVLFFALPFIIFPQDSFMTNIGVGLVLNIFAITSRFITDLLIGGLHD